MYITIDGGTTNTRINLFDNKIIDTVKIDIGARLGLEDKNGLYNGVKNAINDLLLKNFLNEKDIECVIAAGMITSEGGLKTVNHVPAPAGLKELKSGMIKAHLPEITNIPFYFVPGIRLYGETFACTDVMRGEEVEVFGINKLMNIVGEAAYILPGSHSKLIFTDKNGKIFDFFTALTGEMIASLSSGTILNSNVDLKKANLNDMLYTGYSYAIENGINKALFKVRILSNFMNGTKDDAYSFFLGVILADEVEAVKKSTASKVYIAGRAQIKEAEALLLKRFTEKEVILVPDEYASQATSVGMVEVFKTI